MVVLIRNIGNITFHTSALQTSALNMALDFDFDMADNFTVNNIIYSNSGEEDKTRGHSLTSSTIRARSTSPSIESDSGDESHQDKVQYESNNIVENDPVAMLDSP